MEAMAVRGVPKLLIFWYGNLPSDICLCHEMGLNVNILQLSKLGKLIHYTCGHMHTKWVIL